MKVCNKCLEEKSLSEFSKAKRGKDGHQDGCKLCNKKYRDSHKEEISEYSKQYREAHKERLNKVSNQYYADNKEVLRKQKRLYNKANRELVREQHRRAWAVNREENIKRSKQYYANNKETRREKTRAYNRRKALFTSWVNKLPVDAEPKLHADGESLLVSCKLCGLHFAPSNKKVENRLAAFNGTMKGEAHFYCSDACKAACPVYGYQPNQRDPRLPQPDIDPRSCQTDHLKRAQCDENDGQSHCERCGDLVDVETHHNSPIFQYGMEAVSSANHILLCWGCHQKINHATC